MAFLETIATGKRGQVSLTNRQVHADKFAESDMFAGRVIVQGTTATDCDLPASAAELAKVLGVTCYDSTKYAGGAGGEEYASGAVVQYMTEGRIYCETTTAVGDRDKVYVVPSGASAGKCTNSSARAAATPAVIALGEADANVDDGKYSVIFHLEIDGVAGPQFEAEFTASSTTHANCAAGLKAAIEALADVTATPAAEAADNIDITIAVDATTDVLAAFVVDQLEVPSSGTTLAVDTQGAENPAAVLVAGMRFAETTSTAGTAKVDVNLPA